MPRVVFLILVSLLPVSCCMQDISPEAFRNLTLAEKIDQYERVAASGCIRGERLSLLDAIASHGYLAADAMATLVEDHTPRFPLQDVMIVLRFIHSGGFDLRKHPVMAILRRMASSDADPTARQIANQTIAHINGLNTPGPRRRPVAPGGLF